MNLSFVSSYKTFISHCFPNKDRLASVRYVKTLAQELHDFYISWNLYSKKSLTIHRCIKQTSNQKVPCCVKPNFYDVNFTFICRIVSLKICQINENCTCLHFSIIAQLSWFLHLNLYLAQFKFIGFNRKLFWKVFHK